MDEQQEEGRGVSDEGKSGGSRTLQAWLAGIAIGCLIVAAMIASYEIGKNNADEPTVARAPGTGAAKPAPEPVSSPGMTLFSTNCGTCHTLAAADTTGAIGPNLDDLQPDAALVVSAIENGGAGSGAMPAGIVTGEQAQQVADYVAESAGSGN
jgi:mono/diheme cytochrome c family protein